MDATPYLDDILAQPAALSATLAGLLTLEGTAPDLASRFTSGELRRVVLTGMGSSYHALHPLALRLTAHGLDVHQIETGELIHYAPALIGPGSLIVAVSQSGRSAEIVGLLAQAEGHAEVIGVTNTPESPLGQHADVVVLTQAGTEFSVSCKTYVTALAALAWLGDKMTGLHTSLAEMAAAPGAAAHYLAGWSDHVTMLTSALNEARHLFLVGRGPSLAAAGTGGLIIKESAHFHAEGMSSAAFRHGPFEMVGRDVFVLVYAGPANTSDLNARLVDDVRHAGGRAALVRTADDVDPFAIATVPEIVRPILEILPAQMISLAMAQLGGHQAGIFERGSKVTTQE